MNYYTRESSKSISDARLLNYFYSISPEVQEKIDSIAVPALELMQFVTRYGVFMNNNITDSLFMGFKIVVSQDNDYHINYKPEYLMDVAKYGCLNAHYKKCRSIVVTGFFEGEIL